MPCRQNPSQQLFLLHPFRIPTMAMASSSSSPFPTCYHPPPPNTPLLTYFPTTTIFRPRNPPLQPTLSSSSSATSPSTSTTTTHILHKHAEFSQSISQFNRLLAAQDPDSAHRVFHTLLENGFQPNQPTLTLLISSLCKRGKVEKAKQLFNLIGKFDSCSCNLGLQAYNSLLKGLCYVGKVDEALEFLSEMKKGSIAKNLNPDVYSYTAVMDGLCKVGLTEEAAVLLGEAIEAGIVPNAVTFNTLIQGYSREGRPMEGVAVLKLMKEEHGIVPGYVNYSTALHGLLKWNAVKEALTVHKEMDGIGLEADSRMTGKLVRRLCRLSRKEKGLIRDACEVFDKMKQRRKGENGSDVLEKRTMEVMVMALCYGKRFDEALECLNDMVNLGHCPGDGAYERVIQGLCAKGKVEEAVSVLGLWVGNGGVPYRVCYEALIKGLNAQGRSFCASNLFGVALKQGVVVPNREALLCRSYGEGGTAR